eukprot:SAG31_NODE_458_length_15415_cov_3.647428_10_plen_152_part_00
MSSKTNTTRLRHFAWVSLCVHQIGKRGTWWSTWNSDSDWFEDQKDKLRSGVLYFSYSPPKTVTHPSLFGRMYPISVTEIYNGTVIGMERILTLHSGEFSFGSPSVNMASGVCFDAHGTPLSEPAPVPIQGTSAKVTITVPEGGACAVWCSN